MLEKTNEQIVEECGDDPAKWAKALIKMSNGEWSENFLSYWVDQIIAAERRRAASGWRPISDAPLGSNDDVSSYFIGMRAETASVGRNRINVATCYRNEHGAYEWWGGGLSPTHWMPFPEEPEVEDDARNQG